MKKTKYICFATLICILIVALLLTPKASYIIDPGISKMFSPDFGMTTTGYLNIESSRSVFHENEDIVLYCSTGLYYDTGTQKEYQETGIIIEAFSSHFNITLDCPSNIIFSDGQYSYEVFFSSRSWKACHKSITSFCIRSHITCKGRYSYTVLRHN